MATFSLKVLFWLPKLYYLSFLFSVNRQKQPTGVFFKKNGKAPNIFLFKFLKPSYHYLTSFSQNNYILPSYKLTKSKYRTTIRAPKLWNIILNIEEEFIEKPSIFEAAVKTKLVLLENAILYFRYIYKTLKSLTRIFWKGN